LLKSSLLLFVLFTIFCTNINTISAFGEQDSITVTTDKPSYLDGETIIISGEIKDLYSGAPVSLIIKSPNGNLVSIAQITVDEDKKFSTKIVAGGLMKLNGIYTVLVQYWTEDRYAETFFEFGNSTITLPSIPDEPDYSVPVIGWDNFIKYEITGGKLLDIAADRDENNNTTTSLIISVETIHDGLLILTIPRSVADATIDGQNSNFFVLIDGENTAFDETVTPTNRVLAIPLTAGVDEIEVIGTYVVPEFGSITMMILAAAVISIVVITAKSRVIPRY